MLQAVVGWSLHNRVVVVALALLLLGVGCYATWRARLDVFPEFAPPQVVVQTEAPGLSPLEVEQLVTLPIENAVNGLPRLDVTRSQSIQGLSVVTLIFQDRTDIFLARQQVSEHLAELAGQLPAGVKPPRLAPLTATTGRLLTVGFTPQPLSATDYVAAVGDSSTGVGGLPWAGLFLASQRNRPLPNAMQVRDAAQWFVRPRLLAVPGVAQVSIMGGEVRQFQVRVDPAALAAHGLSFTDVLDATRQSTGIQGAGFVENDSQRLTLQVEAQARTAAELGQTVVTTVQGTPVHLRDVAQVREGAEPKFGDAAVGGEPAVVLIGSKQFEADTLETTRRLEAELARLKPQLETQGIAYHPALFRQASFIEHAVGNVAWSLVIGAALVCVVLFVFLFNLRVAFISLTAIPLSLLTAVLVLSLCGVGLNTLTLGGLAIAIGEVVDDAIIDVENIHRRLRENALAPNPRPAFEVVLSASVEVRAAVVYATFIVALVFVPVFFLSGLQGRLFAPLGYAYVLAVLASLVTALTVTPALSLMMLSHRKAEGEGRGASDDKSDAFHSLLAPRPSPLLGWLQSIYDRLLRLTDRAAPPVLTATAALVVAAAAVMVWGVDRRFLPELRENHYVVHMRGLPGTSLVQSMATGKRVQEALTEVSGVRSVNQQAGRAELGEDTEGVEYSEFEVDLEPLAAEQADQVQAAIKERLAGFSGYNFEVLPFLSERIEETLSGIATASVVVKVYGDDLDAIDRTAGSVSDALRRIPGAENVRIESQSGAPQVAVRVRPADAARFGLRTGQVLEAVHAAFQGEEIAQVYDRNRLYDVVVVLDPKARTRPDQVADLWLTTAPADAGPLPTADSPLPRVDAGGPATHGRIQLKQVADLYLSDGRYFVAHENGLRRQAATCNVARGRDPAAFAAEVRAAVARLNLPAGVMCVVGGEDEARRAAQWELSILSLAAGAGIVFLLWLAFQSVRGVLLLLVGVLFAWVGGVAAIYLYGAVLDIGSLIGFVTLSGITMRNGIMMVSHWRHLHDVEDVSWGPELIFRGARERLGPVLMTALVTGLGLLPIAWGAGEAGREIEGPMARVILGGLLNSTALTLFVLPLLYRRFGRGGERPA